MLLERRVIGVFGANGFIGRALVRRLAAEGHRVVAFSRTFGDDFRASKDVAERVQFRLMNLNDALSVQAIMQDITDVVQMINSSSPGMGNTRVSEDLQTNVVPHIDFIRSCLHNNVQRFIFVSSGGTVYGHPEYSPLDEMHPTKPINSYGMTKMVVEQYLRMLSEGSGMSAISLRVSNPFGPGQLLKKGQGLIGSILENYSNGRPITIFGDGEARRDYIYIDDLTDAFIAALHSGTMQEEINIGSGVGRSIRDVISAVEIALGVPLAIETAPGRATDAKLNVLDCRKAERLLGWKAATRFDDAISQTVSAWRS